jgi:hypothetical protein
LIALGAGEVNGMGNWNQKWEAITIESALLAGCAYFFIDGKNNSFFSASALLVLSLLSLQMVSGRFLILYPWNAFQRVPTQATDTVILKVFLTFSLALFVLGVFQAGTFGCVQKGAGTTGPLNVCNEYLGRPLWFIGPILVLALPCVWGCWGARWVRRRLVRRLRDHPIELRVKCTEKPDTCEEPHDCTVTLRVLSEIICEKETTCSKCNYTYVEQHVCPIGY